MAHTSYTQAEEQIIIEAIKQSPDNLSQAFSHASTVIKQRLSKKRTPAALSNYWYSKLKFSLTEQGGEVFAVSSDEGKRANTKNTIGGAGQLSSGGILQALNHLYNLLSEQERKEFIHSKIDIK